MTYSVIKGTVPFGPQMFENQWNTYIRSSENLSIRHVQVQVQVVVQGCSDARPAGTQMQEVAVVTGSTAGCVVSGTGGAGGGVGAHDAGNDSLAGGLLRGADTALCVLGVEAQDSVLAAVDERLGPAQPKPNGPAENTIMQLCVQYSTFQHNTEYDI